MPRNKTKLKNLNFYKITFVIDFNVISNENSDYYWCRGKVSVRDVKIRVH